jgi:hypothetical protein
VFVETLDKCFENVCELDLIFHADAAHQVLDELVMGGMVLQTNMADILCRLQEQNKMQKAEVSFLQYDMLIHLRVYFEVNYLRGARRPRGQCASIAEVKQRWSVIGWVTKNLLPSASPCFGKPVKLLVPATCSR